MNLATLNQSDSNSSSFNAEKRAVRDEEDGASAGLQGEGGGDRAGGTAHHSGVDLGQAGDCGQWVHRDRQTLCRKRS